MSRRPSVWAWLAYGTLAVTVFLMGIAACQAITKGGS